MPSAPSPSFPLLWEMFGGADFGERCQQPWHGLGSACAQACAGASGGASSPDLVVVHRQIEVSGFGECHGLMEG